MDMVRFGLVQVLKVSRYHLAPQRWSIEEVRVKFDMDGRSRGFAFASFRSTELLDSCFDAQPHTIDGKQVGTWPLGWLVREVEVANKKIKSIFLPLVTLENESPKEF